MRGREIDRKRDIENGLSLLFSETTFLLKQLIDLFAWNVMRNISD